MRARVTKDRAAAALEIGPAWGLSPEQMLASPNTLIGSVDQIVEDLQIRRERLGFSYITIPASVIDDFAPIVSRLAGR